MSSYAKFTTAIAHLHACHAAFLAHGYARTSDSKRRMFADHARRCALWGPEWHDEAMRIASLMIECTKVAHRVSYVEPEATAPVEPVAPVQSAPEALAVEPAEDVRTALDTGDSYNVARFPLFIARHGNWNLHADATGYCASIPTVSALAKGCKASHYGDAGYVRATRGIDVLAVIAALRAPEAAPVAMVAPDGYEIQPAPNAATAQGGYTHEAFSPEKAARNGLSSLGYYRAEYLAIQACCDHASRSVAMVAK